MFRFVPIIVGMFVFFIFFSVYVAGAFVLMIMGSQCFQVKTQGKPPDQDRLHRSELIVVNFEASIH